MVYGWEGGRTISIYLSDAHGACNRNSHATAPNPRPVLRVPQVASALDCAFVYKLIKLKVSG